MNYLMPLLLALTLISGASRLDAFCESPPQGPQGSFSTLYIDSFSNTVQTLANATPVNVVFPNNSLVPFGITKSGSNDSFTVLQSGVYLISYAVNATSNEFGSNINFLELTLKINGIPVAPDPIAAGNSLVGAPGQFELSGQTLLTLASGNVVRLEALGSLTSLSDILQIDSALFNIIQIAGAP